MVSIKSSKVIFSSERFTLQVYQAVILVNFAKTDSLEFHWHFFYTITSFHISSISCVVLPAFKNSDHFHLHWYNFRMLCFSFLASAPRHVESIFSPELSKQKRYNLTIFYDFNNLIFFPVLHHFTIALHKCMIFHKGT